MKTFTPIAMRCTKKQFKAINPKLKGLYRQESEFEFIDYPYLTNDYNKEKLCIGTWDNSFFAKDTKVYEVWNEEIFLNACGIEPTYTITKEQLTYLHSVDNIKETIEEWFPNEFNKLKVGKWYKCPTLGSALFCITYIDRNHISAYGFNYKGIWKDNENEFGTSNNDNKILATDQEVSEALIAEAKKRGFKKGVKYKSRASGLIYIFNDELFYSSNELVDGNICKIFKDGVWAEIISEPIEVTLEEIAKLKGCNVEQLRIKE